MPRKLSKLLPVAAAASALCFGGIGTAQAADAYSDAYLLITNLVITGAGPGTSITFTLPSSENSAANACLPNGTCVSTGGAGVTDAQPAQIGIALPNNTYTQQGVLATSYSRADASIDSTQTGGAAFTQARAISEGNIVTNTSANANSGDSSGTVLTSTFDVGGPAQLTFTLDATAFLQALLSGAVAPPSEADASIAASITIVNNATGQTVFSWSPDGSTGGITGGTENFDAFSLNSTLVALPAAPGPLTFDHTCTTAPGGNPCFQAVTNTLAAGTYTLNLSMQTRNNLLLRTVPEPGTLLLMGVGLLGAALSLRRRNA